MIQLILNNLWGYDLIILILALINGFFIYPNVKKASQNLNALLQPKTFVPITLLMARVKGEDAQPLNLNQLQSMRADEMRYYSLFDAVNHAFPMLGMLGTILSLLSMLTLAGEQVVLQFTSALTSTFWGLLFALIFKGFDALLRTAVEQNDEHLKLILDRVDHYARAEAKNETL